MQSHDVKDFSLYMYITICIIHLVREFHKLPPVMTATEQPEEGKGLLHVLNTESWLFHDLIKFYHSNCFLFEATCMRVHNGYLI